MSYVDFDSIIESEQTDPAYREEYELPIVLDTKEAQAFLAEMIGLKALSDDIRASITEDMYK